MDLLLVLEKVSAIEIHPIHGHTNTLRLKMKKIYQNVPKSTCLRISLEKPCKVVNRRNVLDIYEIHPFMDCS
jgi:hypothetical protein